MKESKVIVRLESADLEILKKLAEIKGLTVSAYVRMLIREKTNVLKIQ